MHGPDHIAFVSSMYILWNMLTIEREKERRWVERERQSERDRERHIL